MAQVDTRISNRELKGSTTSPGETSGPTYCISNRELKDVPASAAGGAQAGAWASQIEN